MQNEATSKPFPPVFWSANVTELFERAAYYSMASFVVIYLRKLGFGPEWPSTLNGWLWFLVFFLPILSGTIADQIGFRRSLLLAFVLLASGYCLLGYPVWFGGSTLLPEVGEVPTASDRDWVLVIAGILLVGIGGSFIKPCISGTVQKTAAGRATLAFAIFYMVINIGSLFGRGLGFVVRNGAGAGTIAATVGVLALAAAAIVLLVRVTAKAERSLGDVWLASGGFTIVVLLGGGAIWWLFHATAGERVGVTANLSSIFGVAAMLALAALLLVLLFYREPPRTGPAAPRRSVGRILIDMVIVLRNPRFSIYLLVMSGFYLLYNQVYNVLPLYVDSVVESKAPMDLYTAANPFVIVCFQLLLSRAFGRLRPIVSMVIGTVVIGVAMLINVWPIWAAGGPQALLAHWLPLGSLFIVLTVALVALGELFTSPRMYEYIGALAPKGQEGLYLGYANLPLAIGALVGGPAGALLFNRLMAKDAVKRPDGLLELVPANNMLGWLILTAVGLLSALSLWLFHRWVERHPAAAA